MMPLAASFVRASSTGFGQGPLDLDDPLGRQARDSGLDQPLDDGGVAQAAGLGVRELERAEANHLLGSCGRDVELVARVGLEGLVVFLGCNTAPPLLANG
jgi:hypothetical protein